MAKKKGKARRPKRIRTPAPDPTAPPPRVPRTGTLAVLLGLAVIHLGWALFQWAELLEARRGGEAFCAFASAETCTAVWDSAFANAVQRWTRVPVAGWGVAWSLVAIAFPLWTRLRLRGPASPALPWSATLITALAGVLATISLAVASFLSGGLCSDCVITYALVLAFGAVCLRDLAHVARPQLLRGSALAAAGTAVALALLLWPGMRTPPAASVPDLTLLEPPPEAPPELPPDSHPADRLLSRMLGRMGPFERQNLSDMLDAYIRADGGSLQLPRYLVGPRSAPVRITEFTDALCGHCADLHETLRLMRESLPPDSFSIEPRHFPLDGNCNPNIPTKAETPIRCTAAKAVICAEGQPWAFDMAGALFRNQQTLTESMLYGMAEAWIPRAELEACVRDPATEAKLADDIRWALEYEFPGTPLVLVNGRKASAYPPFLYAILLARGNPRHPLFARLPEPRSGSR